ncbi:MAG TPA: hypothetical protein VFG63_11045 [Nocardioidaceae bacterium]|nr:hypothetical protein [Nocardioidaceae bacterium]
MQHRVKFVSDHELSDGQQWVLVERADEVILFIRESAVTEATLTEAWDNFCQSAAERPQLLVA